MRLSASKPPHNYDRGITLAVKSAALTPFEQKGELYASLSQEDYLHGPIPILLFIQNGFGLRKWNCGILQQ